MGLGTQLRRLLDRLDADVAQAGLDVGLVDYRSRFSPIVRAVLAVGPSPIRDLARAVAVSHSAASQTVAQMHKLGLVELRPGRDGRERVVHLTEKARALLPAVQAEWAVTEAAAADLDIDLPFSLAGLVAAAHAALDRRSFRQRIADQARVSTDPAVTAFGDALSGSAHPPGAGSGN